MTLNDLKEMCIAACESLIDEEWPNDDISLKAQECADNIRAIELPKVEQEICDTCNGTGQQYVGNSGLAEDGNAPEFETCGACGYGESNKELISLIASQSKVEQEPVPWAKLQAGLVDGKYDEWMQTCTEGEFGADGKCAIQVRGIAPPDQSARIAELETELSRLKKLAGM